MNRFALKGDICFNKDFKTWETIEGGYVVCVDGECKGTFKELPEEYKDVPVTDYGHKLIIPGLMDIHLHAPQFAIRALGMDLEDIFRANIEKLKKRYPEGFTADRSIHREKEE